MERDENYVTWGRWQEAHESNLRRLDRLEKSMNGLAGAENVHESMKARITALEQARIAESQGGQERKGRIWVIVVGLMTGIVCPLIVTSVLTVAHLRGHA